MKNPLVYVVILFSALIFIFGSGYFYEKSKSNECDLVSKNYVEKLLVNLKQDAKSLDKRLVGYREIYGKELVNIVKDRSKIIIRKSDSIFKFLEAKRNNNDYKLMDEAIERYINSSLKQCLPRDSNRIMTNFNSTCFNINNTERVSDSVKYLSKLVKVEEFEKAMIDNAFENFENVYCNFGNQPFPMLYADKPVIKIGEEYSVSIFLAKYTKPDSAEISVDNNKLEFKDGRSIYKIRPTSSGMHTFSGDILERDVISGETKKYPFQSSYYVVPK